MKVIAVVGSASNSGKTRVACAVVRAIPGLAAVKISPRDGEPRVEWGAGEPGKDTARLAACGASPVARIVAPRDRVCDVWETMRAALAGAAGVVVEGAGALALEVERFTVFVVGPGTLGERSERDARLAGAADFVIAVGSPVPGGVDGLPLTGCRGSVAILGVPANVSSDDVQPLIDAIRRFLAGQP